MPGHFSEKIALFMSFSKIPCSIFSSDCKLSNRFFFPIPSLFITTSDYFTIFIGLTVKAKRFVKPYKGVEFSIMSIFLG